MKNKTYFTIVQNLDLKDLEMRRFREVVQPNELLSAFHSFAPSMGVSSDLIQMPLDYGFIIQEKISDGHKFNSLGRPNYLGRFDFNRLESALEFSYKANRSIYDAINARLAKAQTLNLRKAFYSMAVLSKDKQQKHQHYLETIAKLQEIGDGQPSFFDFHKHVHVEFAQR
jgi:hypothetical protein